MQTGKFETAERKNMRRLGGLHNNCTGMISVLHPPIIGAAQGFVIVGI